MNQDLIKSYNDYKITKLLEEEKAWTNTVNKYWARKTNTTATRTLSEIRMWFCKELINIWVNINLKLNTR